MNRKMRRFKQQLSLEDTYDIINDATNGVLSLVDPDGTPYGVPVSYVYDGCGHIFIHSALSGYKIDCIRNNPRCSFCVIGQDNIMPEEFTTYYRSVIVSGVIHILSKREEIEQGLLLLCGRYCNGINPSDEIEKCIRAVAVLRIDIDNICGKESIELISDKRQQGR